MGHTNGRLNMPCDYNTLAPHHGGEGSASVGFDRSPLNHGMERLVRVAAVLHLVAVDLGAQLARRPFARVNPNPSYSSVRLRVSDSYDLISVAIRLFPARPRVLRTFVSRNYLRAIIRTPGEGYQPDAHHPKAVA